MLKGLIQNNTINTLDLPPWWDIMAIIQESNQFFRPTLSFCTNYINDLVISIDKLPTIQEKNEAMNSFLDYCSTVKGNKRILLMKSLSNIVTDYDKITGDDGSKLFTFTIEQKYIAIFALKELARNKDERDMALIALKLIRGGSMTARESEMFSKFSALRPIIKNIYRIMVIETSYIGKTLRQEVTGVDAEQ